MDSYTRKNEIAKQKQQINQKLRSKLAMITKQTKETNKELGLDGTPLIQMVEEIKKANMDKAVPFECPDISMTRERSTGAIIAPQKYGNPLST